MTSSRRAVLLVCLLLTGGCPAGFRAAGAPTEATATDERAAKIAERYKAMLLANPVEGLALDRLWKSYDERGAGGELIEEYRRLAEASGSGSAPALIYGHLLRRAGRSAEAEASYERAVTIDPSSPLPWLARAELALTTARAGEAAGFFRAALEKLSPGDRRQQEILFKLGSAWMAAGQPVKAAETWETVVAHDPANVGLRRQLAESYEKNGLSDRALVHYQYIEAHADPAGRAAALRALAHLHETRGQFDAARDALERCLALTARDNWLHGEAESSLIRLYQRAGRVGELEARWRAAAEGAPRDLGGWLRLEALAEAQGDPAGERRALEKVVGLVPRERDYSVKLARRLADDGDRAWAAALYDGLLKVQPDSLDLILARADLDLQLGQPDAAVDRVEARVARNPADDSVSTPALAFYLEHHLDAAAEKRLRDDVGRQPAATEPTLALARFLFAQRRVTEGSAALNKLAAWPGDAVARAVRWTRAAEVYREQNLTPEALHAWQEAAALQPRAAAPLLAAADLLLASGDQAGAAGQIERAATLVSGPEQVEIEHKLFNVLESMHPSVGGDESGSSSLASRRVHPGVVRPDQPLGNHLDALARTAADAPTSEHFLRLARWQSWAHLSEQTLGSAARASELDPANLAARELAASAAIDLRRFDEAETQLQELSARDPAHQSGYRRQLATLKMDNGDRDGAVAILAQLQQSAPGSRDALRDLALAQQRADLWFDAVATWERAYALPGATPAQKDEVRRPLLAACERLGQFSRGAELLRGAVDEQTDASARYDAFKQLAAFCHRHDLGPALREEYEKRLAARPDDYFLLTALAELRRLDGQEREAYALTKRAYYSSPDPVRTLRELAEQAEQLGEDAEAVGYQRWLVALPNQSNAANLEKLAALEDSDFDEAGANHTWDVLVTKFPRDTTVLGHAAERFQRADQVDRARALLRQLVAVDETDARRLLLLGTLDAQAGDAAGAQKHFEQLLARTTAESSGEPLRLPEELESRGEGAPAIIYGRLGGTLRVPHFGRPAPLAAAESEERRLRLQAIEKTSRLLFPKIEVSDGKLNEAQAAWLRCWQAAVKAGEKSEPLAAFYFAGQRDLTLDLLAPGSERADAGGEPSPGAFLNAGLRLGAYQRLADWAWHGKDLPETVVRGKRLVDALQAFLGAGGKPGAGMVDALFPADVKVPELLWAAAQNGFAASFWYPQAAALGERVLAMASTARASYGVAVAEWELYNGNIERAREALSLSFNDPGGNTLETGVGLAALRNYYLLLPEYERPSFVAKTLGTPSAQDGRAHAVLTALVLHGLSGDRPAARRDADRLLALRMMSPDSGRGSPDGRRWTYLLTNGEQLQAWGLDSLAIYLWRRALDDAGAFGLQNNDLENTVTEIRHRLLSAQVAAASDPQQAREHLAAFMAEQPEPAEISSMAARLWTDGQRPAAARLYEVLRRSDPASTDFWPNLYTFYDSTGNQDAAESLLTELLQTRPVLPPGTNRPELVRNLAALRERRGDAPGACRLLELSQQATGGTLPVLMQLAQTNERMGRWDEAAKLWRECVPLDAGASARLGLAAVEEHRGNRSAATAVLREGLEDVRASGRAEFAARLARLLLADHRTNEVRELTDTLLKTGPLEALPGIGVALVGDGQRQAARDILSAAVLRTRDPAQRFRLQQTLAGQWSAPGEDPAGFARQMRQLKKFAQASETLRGEYEDGLYPLAHEQGADVWLEGELQRAWNHGGGEPAAGVQLAGLALLSHREEALREIVQTIDRRPDLPDTLLFELATSLVEGDRALLALGLCERLTRRFPQKLEYQMVRASALWKSDRRPEADLLLDHLAATAVFREDVTDQIAAFYLKEGEPDRAGQCLQRIVKSDPSASHSLSSFLQLAKIALDKKQFAEAGRLLRPAYAQPGCEDWQPLVNYLTANGGLEGDRAREMPAPDFPLTFQRRARLLAAVRDALVRSGRSDDANRLVETHAEFLVAVPALAAELRRGATPATVGTVADCLERACGEWGTPPASVRHELALLYSQWAVWDANDPATRENALPHLARALELEPDQFPVACQLAKQYLQAKRPEKAAEALAAFQTPDALPAERQQARQILAN